MKKHKRLFPTTVMCRVLKISTSGHYDSLRRLPCEQLVRRIMRDIGLYSRIKRKFVVTTDSNHALRIAENILNRDFTAKSANQKWAADITYIPTKLGWLYLAVVMDFSHAE